MSVIRVHCTGSRWCVGFNNDARFGTFIDPFTAITHALDVVSEQLDLPVEWPDYLKVVWA